MNSPIVIRMTLFLCPLPCPDRARLPDHSNRLRLPVLSDAGRKSIERHLIAAAAVSELVRHDCVLGTWFESSQPHHAVPIYRSCTGRSAPRPNLGAGRLRMVQHQHSSDGLGGDEADQPFGRVDDGHGRRRLFLQQAEGLVEAAPIIHSRDIAGHGVGDARVGAAFFQRANEVVASKQANRSTHINRRVHRAEIGELSRARCPCVLDQISA